MHLSARAVAGTIALAALAACSPPEGGTVEEISSWMSEQDRAGAAADTLGTATSRVGPDDPEPTDGAGVLIEYDSPAHVEAVRVSCFGDGTLDFAVETTTPDDAGGSSTTTRGTEVADVACGDDPVDVPLDVDGVTSVRMSGSGADRTGAWHAEVLGERAG